MFACFVPTMKRVGLVYIYTLHKCISIIYHDITRVGLIRFILFKLTLHKCMYEFVCIVRVKYSIFVTRHREGTPEINYHVNMLYAKFPVISLTLIETIILRRRINKCHNDPEDPYQLMCSLVYAELIM